MSRGRLIKEEEDTDVRTQTPAQPVRGDVLELGSAAGFAPVWLGMLFIVRKNSGTELMLAYTSSRDVNKNDSTHCHRAAVNIKTLMFIGKTAWEVFIAQIELLVSAASWSDKHKALQLALCLSDDAAAYLLLLS